MSGPDVYGEAELYCAAFAGPVDREITWLAEQVGGFGPGTPIESVLEPFCGNARYAAEFTRRGARYTGLDLSRAMLDRAAPGLRTDKPSLSVAPGDPGVTLFEADARDFDVGGPFDLAWCPVNSLCHLSDEADIRAHLACVRRHLPDGRFYVVELELFRHDGPWDAGPPGRSRWSVTLDDGSVLEAECRREHCDLASRTCTERLGFRRVGDGGKGAVLAEHATLFTMRMWLYEDLLRLAAAAGFRVERAFRHEKSTSRPQVPLGPQLENDGDNFYFFLKAG